LWKGRLDMRVMLSCNFLIHYSENSVDCDTDIYSCRLTNKALETLLKNKNLKNVGLELLRGGAEHERVVRCQAIRKDLR
jgi:hypothetical protein